MGNTGTEDSSVTKCINTYYYPYTNKTGYDIDTAEGILDACNQRESVLIAGYIMVVFFSLLLVPLVFITFKVKKLVWHRDKIMPLMLTFLTGCVFSFLCYFIFVQVSEYKLVWQNGGSQSYTCSVIYFAELPAFFLSIGIILNANKWISFLLRVRAFVRTEKETVLRRAASEF